MQIILTPTFDAEFEKLAKDAKEQVFAKLKQIENETGHYLASLKNDERLKIRAGDYRIFGIRQGGFLYITFVGHRKNVYKKHVF